MEMAIRSRVKLLHARKEVEEGRSIPYREISQKTGLSTRTLSALFNNETTLYAANTLSQLCSYYGCAIGDLIEHVPEEIAA
ncbi:MAG: helix-turn-helix transcriptional regulator [Anaerolineae bacterium]|nr:helix-turn-helix transcriptional regulator [Anaerolineae bacterium]